jgi:hypothetical protein
VTVTNTGTADLHVSQAVPSGPGFSLGLAGNTCGTVIPGNSCTIQVQFKPTQAGAATGALTITDDAADSPQTVALSGNAIRLLPVVSVAPDPVSFPDRPVGGTVTSAVVVTNTGTGSLHVTGAQVSGPFSVTNETCTGAPVLPNGTCTIDVAFAPTQTGPATGTLTISDDTLNNPQAVPLSGMGTKPAPVVTGIAPSEGPASGGTTVTIQGDDFVAGGTEVTIGGVVVPASDVVIAGDPTATFTTPAHAPGVVSVVVSTASGTSSQLTFTYAASPSPPNPPPPNPPAPSPSSGTGGLVSTAAGGTSSTGGSGQTGSGAPSATSTQTGSLALTGTDLGSLVAGGVLLLLAGATLLFVRRRPT